MMHCHYLLSVDDTILSMPEVTLPVVPGMEGCHWALRKADKEGRKQLVKMLLEGKPVKAKEAVGWLVDFSGSLETSLKKAWQIMQKGTSVLPLRKVEENSIGKISFDEKIFYGANGKEESVKAIAKCIEDSCNAKLSEAISIQAIHSANFMVTKLCRKGKVGSEYDKIMTV